MAKVIEDPFDDRRAIVVGGPRDGQMAAAVSFAPVEADSLDPKPGQWKFLGFATDWDFD